MSIVLHFENYALHERIGEKIKKFTQTKTNTRYSSLKVKPKKERTWLYSIYPEFRACATRNQSRTSESLGKNPAGQRSQENDTNTDILQRYSVAAIIYDQMSVSAKIRRNRYNLKRNRAATSLHVIWSSHTEGKFFKTNSNTEGQISQWNSYRFLLMLLLLLLLLLLFLLFYYYYYYYYY